MSKLIKFDNGLTLAHNYIDSVRSVAMGVMVSAGCINETKEQNGISHFIEHMVFKGTKTRSAFDIADELESIGAMFNAYTSKMLTCFYTVSLDEYAKKCIEVLSDIYFNATFPEDEMEKEKGVVLEEIAMTDDTPDDVCLDNLACRYFEGHSLGKTILGPAENVKGFTQAELKDYVKKYYVPNNTVISIVGKITEQDAVKLVEEYFDTKNINNVVKQPVVKHVTKSSKIIVEKPINQANVGIAFPGFSLTNEKTDLLRIFNTVFGEAMTSRLFQIVREKLGLVYTIFSSYSQYVNNGYYWIYFATNPEHLKEAVIEIKQEIKNVLDNGITDVEFNRAKVQLKSGLVMGSESTTALMRAFGNSALLKDELFDIDEKLERIENCKIEDIKEIVDYIFDFDKVSVSYVGPKTDFDILEELRRK